MKNFNWELFKKGKLTVCCGTVEEELDFLEECEKRGFEWCSGCKPTQRTYLKEENLEEIYFDHCFCALSYSSSKEIDIEEILQLVHWKVEPKTNFTWREVFANIQEGEEYTLYNKFIKMVDGRLMFGDDTGCMSFSVDVEFTKKEQRKPVDFEQALAALKEGKTVESDLNGIYYKLQNETLRRSFGGSYWEAADLTYGEITDKWYIID